MRRQARSIAPARSYGTGSAITGITSDHLPLICEQGTLGRQEALRSLWTYGDLMLLEPLNDENNRLSRLSPKERELLDQILLHKSLKVIAHELGVTPSAVDQRLKSARVKLGAIDRNDAARRYSSLLAGCRESTSGFAQLGTGPQSQLTNTSEPHGEQTFTFHDSATIDVVPSWFERQHRGGVPEYLDEKSAGSGALSPSRCLRSQLRCSRWQ